MSKLRSVSDYQREIAEVEAMIRRARAGAGELDFAAELMVASLEERRSALAEELERLGDEGLPGHEIDVVLTGRPVRAHSVEAGFLAKVLHDIQSLVSAIVSSTSGRQTRAGPLAAAVRRTSTLRFAGSFEGSFGMRLEAVDEQLPLGGDSMLAPTFDQLLGLIGNSNDQGGLLDQLAPLGARARAHYRKLLQHLESEGADLRVVWPTMRGPREAALRAADARRLLESLGRVTEDVDGRYYDGVLDGANTRRGHFEFETEDGEVIAGSVEPDIVARLRRYFDRRCRAYILTRVVSDSGTGDRRVHHRLQDLEDAEDPLQRGLFAEE